MLQSVNALNQARKIKKINSLMKKKIFQKEENGIWLKMRGDKEFVEVNGLNNDDTFRLNQLLRLIEKVNQRINEENRDLFLNHFKT